MMVPIRLREEGMGARGRGVIYLSAGFATLFVCEFAFG